MINLSLDFSCSSFFCAVIFGNGDDSDEEEENSDSDGIALEGDSDIEYDPVPSKPGSAVHSEDGDGSEDSCSGLYSDSEEDDDDEKSKLVNTSSQSQDCGIFDEW